MVKSVIYNECSIYWRCAVTFFDSLFTQELKQIRHTAESFARAEIMPFVQRWEEEEWFPVSLHERAGALGLLGAGFPEEVGGVGGGPMHMLMVIEGLLRGGSTGVVVGLSSVGIAVPPLIASRDQTLIDVYVRPALRGALIASLAVTEPGAGSDVAGIKTRGRREGDHYIIQGAKLFITSGKRAHFFTTLVRTSDDPHAGLTFFVIDADLEGVRVSAPLHKTGWRASDTVEVEFDEVKVPLSRRVGPEGSGFLFVMQNFQTERLALAAYGAMTAQICYEEAVAYTRQREAFGRPLSGFQVTRHKLADMATQVIAARALVYQVAEAMSRGDEVVAEVSMAKNFTAEVAQRVSYEAVQLFGGMGYMRETLVERLSRDARLLPIGGGTQEVMKEIIAKRLNFAPPKRR
jgi:acyl-CoA dehydrogenase